MVSKPPVHSTTRSPNFGGITQNNSNLRPRITQNNSNLQPQITHVSSNLRPRITQNNFDLGPKITQIYDIIFERE